MAGWALTQLSCSSAEEPVWQLGLQVHTTTSQQAAHCHCPARPLSKFFQHTGIFYLIRFCLRSSAAPFRDVLQFKTRLKKVLSPLSLQRRSHLVNVHRTRTSLAENFLIFILVLLSFDKESSGVEGGGGLYKNLIQ